MRRRASIALAALAALVLLVGCLAPPAVATLGHSPGPHPDAGGSANYTLSELSTDGTHYKKPSARIADQHVWWLTHQPADKPWSSEKKLLENGIVKSNTLYLNSIRVAPEPTTKTVKIVFWERGTREVREGNRTVEKPVAVNQTVVTQNVTLGQGWPTEKIDLPQHDDRKRMTMWVVGMKDEARWTLEHQSIATTQTAPVQSMGDLIWWVVTHVVLWTIIGTLVVGWLMKRALDKAGIGPQWGYLPWVILLTVGTGVAVFGFFGNLAAIFVHLPYVFAAYLSGIIAIVILETHTQEVSKALFLRPNIEDAVSPSGEDAVDMQRATAREERVLKREGRLSVVKQGLFPFLARAFGGAAELEGAEEIETEIALDGSKWDYLYVTDPDSEEVIDYKPEGWSLDLPSFSGDGQGDVDDLFDDVEKSDGQPDGRDNVLGALAQYAGVLGVGGLVGYYLSPLFAAGAVAVLVGWLWVHPRDGYARIDPAQAHLRSAYASMLFLASETDEAKTIKDARKRNISLQSHNQQDVEEALEDQDMTLVEAMFGGNVERADVSSEESEDDRRRANGRSEVSAGD